MKITKLRNWIALILITSHVMIISLVCFLPFSWDEAFNLISIIAPLFASYTTIIITHIMNENVDTQSDEIVTRAKANLSLAVPTIFAVALFITIMIAQFTGKIDFNTLIKLVGSFESLIGVYLGMIIKNLFNEDTGKGAHRDPGVMGL